VEELVLPQRLRDAVGVVQAGHLLVTGLGVDADISWCSSWEMNAKA